MKKNVLLMLLSGIMFISGGLALVSCDKDDADKNTLSVAPNSDISFEAANNADVVLTITTDASSWDFK